MFAAMRRASSRVSSFAAGLNIEEA